MKRYGHPRVHELLEELSQLHEKKNFDYAEGARQGTLGGFQRAARIISLYPNLRRWVGTPEGVAFAYMLKQLDAALIMLSTQKQSKTGEGLVERLKDIAMYATILVPLVEARKGGDEWEVKDARTLSADAKASRRTRDRKRRKSRR